MAIPAHLRYWVALLVATLVLHFFPGPFAALVKYPDTLVLRLTDPTAHRIGVVEIELDLVDGWAGLKDAERSVRVTERKRSGLRHYLETIMDKEPLRYDDRN